MNNLVVAPSFNGRTADSGSAYRGSNPWGAANIHAVFITSTSFSGAPCTHCVHKIDGTTEKQPSLEKHAKVRFVGLQNGRIVFS